MSLGLDRGAGDGPVVAPDPGWRQVTMETVLPRPQTHNETVLMFRRDQAPRHGQTVDEPGEGDGERSCSGAHVPILGSDI